MRKHTLLLTILFIFITILPSAAELEVHFLDVGQADAILIIQDEHAMLIDGGNPENSQLIYTYLKQLNINHLDYIVNTHGDADHVGGLPAAGISVNGNVGVALSSYSSCDKERYISYTDALSNYGITPTAPIDGYIYTLGDAWFQILHPGESSCDGNTSIMLRLVYGNTAFVFTGDAPIEEELEVLKKRYELNSDVLKIGHHGSGTSTSIDFLTAVSPSYAVISCGKDNPYGHPMQSVLDKLSNVGANILRTDEDGLIIIVSDGDQLYASAQHMDITSTATPVVAAAEGQEYILNTRSKKFHLPDCDAAASISEKNKLDLFDARENIVAMGYDPCGRCNP